MSPSPKPKPRPHPKLDYKLATEALHQVQRLPLPELIWVLDRLPVSTQREILMWADRLTPGLINDKEKK